MGRATGTTTMYDEDADEDLSDGQYQQEEEEAIFDNLP